MTGTAVRSRAYRALRRPVLRVLRRVPRALAVARALVAEEFGGQPGWRRDSSDVRLDIRAGQYVDDRARRNLPIVVFVATGPAGMEGDRIAAAVEHAQVFTGSFRPLFVIDHGGFAPFRARGFAVEHVMSESAYAAVRPHDTYAEYLFQRVASIVRSYGARSVVPLNGGGLPDQESLRLIGAVGPAGERG